MTEPRKRRWVGRAFAVFYVVSVAVVIVLLAVVGEGVLAAWLGAIEAASVITLRLVTRHPPAPIAGDPARPSGARLGSPLDPGMPSGRKKPSPYARPRQNPVE
jgi:hypothetical protein